MEIVNSSPMLAVPGCDDNAILANEPMVVKALNTTARGVLLVAIAFFVYDTVLTSQNIPMVDDSRSA